MILFFNVIKPQSCSFQFLNQIGYADQEDVKYRGNYRLTVSWSQCLILYLLTEPFNNIHPLKRFKCTNIEKNILTIQTFHSFFRSPHYKGKGKARPRKETVWSIKEYKDIYFSISKLPLWKFSEKVS